MTLQSSISLGDVCTHVQWGQGPKGSQISFLLADTFLSCQLLKADNSKVLFLLGII